VLVVRLTRPQYLGCDDIWRPRKWAEVGQVRMHAKTYQPVFAGGLRFGFAT